MRARPLFLLTLVLLLFFVAFIYFPGLSGDFEFDDAGNIADNQQLHISALTLEQLRSAAFSGDAGPTGRPATLLTFALNLFFFGMQPFYFKLVNLFIHLANVVLVAYLSSFLLRRACRFSSSQSLFAGLTVAALWGVHPINLTSILYVVQRMTSLSAFFGFVALLMFVWCRQGGLRWYASLLLGFGILFCLLLSILCKESGVLFVLLMFWIELAIFEFKSSGRTLMLGKFSLQSVVVAVGGLLALYVVIWIVPPMISPAAYMQRDFTLVERILTESRVLFMYLGMILYPTLSGLSLYHDDFLISKSIVEPIQTLYSCLALFGILLAIGLLWSRWRILAFALGWFLIAHLLESTVFSLELVHEHRNYFASIGFFCVFASWLAQLRGGFRLCVGVVGVGFFLLYAFVTYNRSLIWSNLVDHAAFEAAMHPKSDRANYQMGRIYLKLLDNTHDKRFADKAREYFLRASESYTSGNGSYFALIHLSYYLGEKPDELLIKDLSERLRTRPFYNSNVGFLKALVDCQLSGFCHVPVPELIGLMASAVENPRVAPESSSQVYLLLARYFTEGLGDLIKGEEFIRDSIRIQDQVGGRLMLVQVLRLQGRYADALTQLERAEAMDRYAINSRWIGAERSKLQDALKNEKSRDNAAH